MAELTLPRSVLRESPRPLVVRFMAWTRENRQAIIDLVFLLLLGGLIRFFFYPTDFFETFYRFSRAQENWQLDDTVFAAALIFAPLFMIFATRRWIEAARNLRKANTDSLTGLFNRRKAWEIIEAEMQRAARYQRGLSLILFDIDEFKKINDTHGHLVGDRVIKDVSRVVYSQLRKTDTFCKWGGDEFVIICSETSLDGARQLAERLRAMLEQMTLISGDHLTASFGLARFLPNDNFDSFFLRADQQLYEAKLKGKNRVA